jgi:hypoxanthine phosphoribosyltransferase
MATIKVLDKAFESYISHETIIAAIKKMVIDLERDLADKNPLFLVILNGAFMFAGDLFKLLHFPAEISFIKFVSYSGTHSTGHVRQLIGLDESVEGRTVVLVEDIVDTGISMEKVLEYLSDKKIKDLRIATLLFKPNSYQKHFKIDYIGMEIPNDFIIGYGLDYNGQARNLKDIYKIIQ